MRVLRYFPVQMVRGDDVLKDHEYKPPYYEFLRYKRQLADPLVDKSNVKNSCDLAIDPARVNER